MQRQDERGVVQGEETRLGVGVDPEPAVRLGQDMIHVALAQDRPVRASEVPREDEGARASVLAPAHRDRGRARDVPRLVKGDREPRHRLERALEGLRVGKLSGAVGTYSATDPDERIRSGVVSVVTAETATATG